MYHRVDSDSYRTVYLSWPDHISRRCDICGTPLRFAHADNGKLIRTLNGVVHQVVYKYTCPNPKCENWKRYINPASRYDYGGQYYGRDVINKVAREIFVFEQNPEQIHRRLTLDYSLDISLRTVQRMYSDCLIVKSNKIDEETENLIKKNKGIILAADGQDPGAGMKSIWLFTDTLSGRVLYTHLTDSMPAEKLQELIYTILEKYNTRLLGFVSDKQNNLVKCMRDYFPEVPHQYCTWHFTSHLWRHMEMYDNGIYMYLKSGINKLYIHRTSTSAMINFEEHGLLSVREVFADIDNDLRRLLGVHSKRFKELRGLALYRGLKRYTIEMKKGLSLIIPNSRFGKIYKQTLSELEFLLDDTGRRFAEDLFLFDTFKAIYSLLYDPILEREEREHQLNLIFEKCMDVVRNTHPEIRLEDLRSFNPKSDSTFLDILGEWYRLWNSYRPGLFQYYQFPIPIRTNVSQERAFSIEKNALRRRTAHGNVSLLQELQGEFYLRFSHCRTEELRNDFVKQYMSTEIRTLRSAYRKKVRQLMSNWFNKADRLEGIDLALRRFGRARESR